MRIMVFVWAAVEVLQIVVIGVLIVGYRNLQRRLDGGDHFAAGPPRSVTEE